MSCSPLRVRARFIRALFLGEAGGGTSGPTVNPDPEGDQSLKTRKLKRKLSKKKVAGPVPAADGAAARGSPGNEPNPLAAAAPEVPADEPHTAGEPAEKKLTRAERRQLYWAEKHGARSSSDAGPDGSAALPAASTGSFGDGAATVRAGADDSDALIPKRKKKRQRGGKKAAGKVRPANPFRKQCEH